MREELIRARGATEVVLFREWLNQRSNVSDDRQLPVSKERVHCRQVWMQTERPAEAFRRYRQKAVLCNGKRRRSANGIVSRISIQWHDSIVAVIATAEENAHQCFVAGALGKRLNQPETLDSRRERGGRQRAATGPTQKLST